MHINVDILFKAEETIASGKWTLVQHDLHEYHKSGYFMYNLNE
jgi:hypothetical protein